MHKNNHVLMYCSVCTTSGLGVGRVAPEHLYQHIRFLLWLCGVCRVSVSNAPLHMRQLPSTTKHIIWWTKAFSTHLFKSALSKTVNSSDKVNNEWEDQTAKRNSYSDIIFNGFVNQIDFSWLGHRLLWVLINSSLNLTYLHVKSRLRSNHTGWEFDD